MHFLVLLFFRRQEKDLPMCSDIAIKLENISKCYQIYKHPQDRLKQSIYPRLQRFLKNQPKQYYREFRALKDISFEIKKGETVGIIGANGSGKSTLLQIICGTLNPTSGSLHTNGRIAALLELGSGFNPEFTGRENVYLNAAILGLSQTEIESKLDNILGFADIGDFLDQPVKTYSSGMFVRLAFSVNIMSDPEIMVVDEALAVGDMRFQAKCITALKRIQDNGATILFVSHDLGTVKNLCKKGIYLEEGNLRTMGDAPMIAEEYNRAMREKMNNDNNEIYVNSTEEVAVINQDSIQLKDRSNRIFKASDEFNNRIASSRYGTGEAKITYVELLDQNSENIIEARFDQEVSIRIYFVSYATKTISPNYYIHDDKKNKILGAGPQQIGKALIEAKDNDRFVVTYKTQLPLREGAYSLEFTLTEAIVKDKTAQFLDVIDDAIVFKVSRKKEAIIWSKVFIPNTMEVESL